MRINRKQILKTFRPTNIFLAVILGVSVSFYNFYIKTSEKGTIDQFLNSLVDLSIIWVVLAFLVLLVRDLGYVYRLRFLTQKELSWKSSVNAVLLWEFASAVTPSVVGGSAVAVFILNKEKISFGKSLAYVMLTAILDNLFFILLAPFVLFFIPGFSFPVLEFADFNLKSVFWVSYILILVYTLFMATGVFLAPKSIKWILVKLCSLPLLRKWKDWAQEQGEQIKGASVEFKGKGLGYWSNAVGATMFIWAARYLMLNCLIAAFTSGLTLVDHTSVFGNQIVMWVAQLLSPTPGSGGFAEVYFDSFFGSYFNGGGMSDVVGFIWRFMTSYLYLIIGAIVLRVWVKKVFFGNRNLIKFKES